MTREFSPYEVKIIQALYKYNRPMSIPELSDKCEISYQTVVKYLDNLKKEGIVKKGDFDKTLWQLNY
ncbi:helix-turn-helix transcriptional regulator [Candidatus Woesearchaeota archaeon]|nr:helix-turn-helix transcriptional regulator [Candidatus Woesearchaeota archaeon]